MTPEQIAEALHKESFTILSRLQSGTEEVVRLDAALYLLRTLAEQAQFPPDYPDGPDRGPAAEPQSNPLTELHRMKIIGDEFPIALVDPIIIQKIDSVCIAIERAVLKARKGEDMTPSQRAEALRLAKALQNLGNEEEDAANLLRTLAAEPQPCVGNDPLCPCQDGLACHYKDASDGTKAWPVPEPQSAPVAWLCELNQEDGSVRTQIVTVNPDGFRWNDIGEPSPFRVTPLYLHPAPAQTPLTDEEIAAAVRSLYGDDIAASMGLEMDIATARAVLKAQKEKT